MENAVHVVRKQSWCDVSTFKGKIQGGEGEGISLPLQNYILPSSFSFEGLRKSLKSKYGWTEKERQEIIQKAKDD